MDINQPQTSPASPSFFSPAAGPLAATAVLTGAENLDAANIIIPSGDFQMPAYQARPKRAGRLPFVIVVQEIFGLHEYIKDICRRLATEGYFAVAPDLYARQGDASKFTDMQELIQKIVSKVPDAQVMADLDATLNYAESTGTADTERFGITGFCWGGRAVWLYSAHQPKLKAGVAWYGRLAAGPYSSSLTPEQPLDVASRVHGAILGLYGGQDESIPLQVVDRMREALKAAGKDRDCQIVIYPDAGHAFHADYRPSYNEAAAKDGWTDCSPGSNDMALLHNPLNARVIFSEP